MNCGKLMFQILKFGLVGIVAACVDVGCLVVLNEIAHIEIMISSAVSFTVSVIVNYFLSMAFVFKGKNTGRIKEFVLFVGLCVGGLLINQIIMWLGTEFTSICYLVVKLAAMIIVPVYNFITRKIFLEKSFD